MRLVSVDSKPNNFWAAHLNNENAQPPVGTTGAPLKDLIENVNRFTTDYPGEVIIWNIRYMVNLQNSPVRSNKWDDAWHQAFYDALEGINNRCSLDLLGGLKSFDRVPIGKMMESNGGKGCVLLIVQPQDTNQAVRENKGIFGDSKLNRTDNWAQKETSSETMPAEVEPIRQAMRSKADTDKFSIMQWKADPPGGQVSIQYRDFWGTNPWLYWFGLNNFSPDYFPTVILENALGLFYSKKITQEFYNTLLQNFVIGMNMYMVTQNCKVSQVGFPFTSNKDYGLSKFHGVAFFNGTVLPDAPPGFRRDLTYV